MESNKLKEIADKITFSPRCELVQGKNDIPKLYLYGTIVEEIPRNWWTSELADGDYITMNEVKKAFDEITGDEVEIHLNSKGGDVYTSVAISNYIKDSKKTVTIIIDAIAASGGSIIAMAGDKIKMYPNSLLMIHRASTYIYGNADELRKIAENLEKFDESVQASYIEHFKGTKEELKDMIYAETYLTADECQILGFCDEVIKKADEKDNSNNPELSVKNSILQKYKNKSTERNNLLSNFRR